MAYGVAVRFLFWLRAAAARNSRNFGRLARDVKRYEEERQQLNETFRLVRSERHDFLKHVAALHYLLENREYEDAYRYLKQPVGSYEETNLSIKGERGVVAGILYQIYRRAKALGIDVVYDLNIPLSTLPMSEKEIVIFIGNLLENAIDACEEWQKRTKKQANLILQFYKRSGLFLLTVSNHTCPIPNEILDELFVSAGKTTKGKGHEGLGTKIISDMVKKYDGYLDFEYYKEQFKVKIKIPAIAYREDSK